VEVSAHQAKWPAAAGQWPDKASRIRRGAGDFNVDHQTPSSTGRRWRGQSSAASQFRLRLQGGRHQHGGLSAASSRAARRSSKSSRSDLEVDQARNLIVEGDNLHAMVSLYKYRDQVDLVLADPPYNTGSDFRYNNKWDEDPNDPDLGALVPAEVGSRHSKWLRFMVPLL
jgi:hypothetical protein